MAAEKDCARAQDKLGWCYVFGEGVERNYSEAVNWWKMAEETRRIEEKKKTHSDNEFQDDYDWRNESWDAMTDGMYGDMPDGFDGDYGFLGW